MCMCVIHMHRGAPWSTQVNSSFSCDEGETETERESARASDREKTKAREREITHTHTHTHTHTQGCTVEHARQLINEL